MKQLTTDKMNWDSTRLGRSDNLAYTRLFSKFFWKKNMSRGSEGEESIDVRELGTNQEFSTTLEGYEHQIVQDMNPTTAISRLDRVCFLIKGPGICSVVIVCGTDRILGTHITGLFYTCLCIYAEDTRRINEILECLALSPCV